MSPDDSPHGKNSYRVSGAPFPAVIAGLVVLIPVWIVVYVLFNKGFIDHRFKDLGTAIDFAAFAIPFAVVRFLYNRRRIKGQKKY